MAQEGVQSVRPALRQLPMPQRPRTLDGLQCRVEPADERRRVVEPSERVERLDETRAVGLGRVPAPDK